MLRDLVNEFRALASSYPSFVTVGGSLPADELPVFVFHTIEPDEFGETLDYLRVNGYATLSLDEAYRHLSGERVADKPVLLTIDDARSSVWRFGAPLLARYGARATLFVIPGLTEETRPEPWATLRDVWSGTGSVDALRDLDRDDATLCTWAELRAMAETGVFDYGSHTQHHARVFADSTPIGIFGPWSRKPAYKDERTAYRVLGRTAATDPASLYGAPLFRTVPLFAAKQILAPSDAFLQACLERYGALSESLAGEELHRRLLADARKLATPSVMEASPETERVMIVKRELDQARRALTERFGQSIAVDCVCLPYAQAREEIVDLARELGIRALFWGVRQDRRSNSCPGDLARIVRIKGDFVSRLPGKGRSGLTGVYLRKATRRLAGRRPY